MTIAGGIHMDKSPKESKPRSPRKTLAQRVAAIDHRLRKLADKASALHKERESLIAAAKAELAAATSSAEAGGTI